MTVASTDELVLAALAGPATAAEAPQPAADTCGMSLDQLLSTVGSDRDAVSARVELLSTIDHLEHDGRLRLITEAETEALIVELTADGVEDARSTRTELAETPIEVVDDEQRCERPLGSVASASECDVVEVAAACSTDGVYYEVEAPPADELVGRESECETWTGLLERVVEERCGEAVVLTGPGGIGKTTLVDEFVDRARAFGFETARVHCEGAEPFRPVRDLVAEFDESDDPHGLETTVLGDDPDTYEANKLGLFHDCLEILTPADTEPVRVIVVDDLHLTDPTTVDFLDVLVEWVSSRPIVMVATYRPTAFEAESVLAGDSESDVDSSVEVVALEPFDRTETRSKIEQVLGWRGIPDDLVDAVFHRTGGNPLFVEEVVERLLETDQLDPHCQWYPTDPDKIDVPDELKETIVQRVEELDSQARDVLRWAALADDSVPVAVLERVCEQSDSRVRTLVHLLVDAGVFEPVGSGDAITFQSGAIREALRGDILNEVRPSRHASLAAAFEQVVEAERTGQASSRAASDERENADRSATIARHYEAADDHERAVEWYRVAADRAMDTYANEAALEHYQNALLLADDAGDEPTVLDIAESIAEITITTGDLETAERYLAFVSERTDDPERIANVAIQECRIAILQSEFRDAIDTATAELAKVEEPSVVRCKLLLQKITAERDLGWYDQGAETAAEMLEEATAIDAPELVAAAHRMLGEIHYYQNAFEAALNHHQEALVLTEENGDVHGSAICHHVIANVYVGRSEYERAYEHQKTALELYERVGDNARIPRMHCNMGSVFFRLDDHERARDYLHRSYDGLLAIGDRRGAGITMNFLGLVDLAESRYDRARSYFEDALAELTAVDSTYYAADSHRLLGDLALETGDFDRARSRYSAASSLYEELGNTHLEIRMQVLLGVVDRKENAYDAAAERLRDVLSEIDQEGEEAEIFAMTHRNLGLVSMETDALEAAVDHLQEAAETYIEIDATEEALETIDDLVSCGRDRGDNSTVREWIERAHQLIEESDEAFSDHREWIERHCEELGVEAVRDG